MAADRAPPPGGFAPFVSLERGGEEAPTAETGRSPADAEGTGAAPAERR
jgi:hypothetical protein